MKSHLWDLYVHRQDLLNLDTLMRYPPITCEIFKKYTTCRLAASTGMFICRYTHVRAHT